MAAQVAAVATAEQGESVVRVDLLRVRLSVEEEEAVVVMVDAEAMEEEGEEE